MSPLNLDLCESLLRSSAAADVRRAVDWLVVHVDGQKHVVLALIEALKVNDHDLRESVAGVLEGVGAPKTSDRQSLTQTLQPSNAAIMTDDQLYWVITLLGRLGIDAEESVESLLDLLIRPISTFVIDRTLWSLSKIVRSPRDVPESVSALLDSPHPRTRRLAQQAARVFGSGAAG